MRNPDSNVQNTVTRPRVTKSDIVQAQGKGFTQWTDSGSGIHAVARPRLRDTDSGQAYGTGYRQGMRHL
jgi:hypothetical protein